MKTFRQTSLCHLPHPKYPKCGPTGTKKGQNRLKIALGPHKSAQRTYFGLGQVQPPASRRVMVQKFKKVADELILWFCSHFPMFCTFEQSSLHTFFVLIFAGFCICVLVVVCYVSSDRTCSFSKVSVNVRYIKYPVKRHYVRGCSLMMSCFLGGGSRSPSPLCHQKSLFG